MQDVGSTGGFSLSPFAHSKHLMERGERDLEMGLNKLMCDSSQYQVTRMIKFQHIPIIRSTFLRSFWTKAQLII